jgi:hypothetical protein
VDESDRPHLRRPAGAAARSARDTSVCSITMFEPQTADCASSSGALHWTSISRRAQLELSLLHPIASRLKDACRDADRVVYDRRVRAGAPGAAHGRAHAVTVSTRAVGLDCRNVEPVSPPLWPLRALIYSLRVA